MSDMMHLTICLSFLCDANVLSYGFISGDEIEILTRTEKEDDWWEGKLHGRIGIFPANYVEVM